MAGDIGENVELILNRSVKDEELPPAMKKFAEKTEADGKRAFDVTDLFVAIGRDIKAIQDNLARPWWKKLFGIGKTSAPKTGLG